MVMASPFIGEATKEYFTTKRCFFCESVTTFCVPVVLHVSFHFTSHVQVTITAAELTELLLLSSFLEIPNQEKLKFSLKKWLQCPRTLLSVLESIYSNQFMIQEYPFV